MGYIEIAVVPIESVKASEGVLKHSLRAEGISEQLSVRNFRLTLIDEQLLQLLSPLEPLKRHADVKSMRLENTGTWLLKLECFHKWCNVKSTSRGGRILCCYGMPGAGKTLIRSTV